MAGTDVGAFDLSADVSADAIKPIEVGDDGPAAAADVSVDSAGDTSGDTMAGDGSASPDGSVDGQRMDALAGAVDAGGPLPEDMIDNLDDGDDAILPIGGRAGYWYSFNDMSPGGQQTPASGAQIVPVEGGPSNRGHHVRTTGSGFKSWGAGVGVDLNNPGGGKIGRYDVTQYRGISFWARSNVPFRVALATAGVLPVEEGGTCVQPPSPGPQDCYDSHAALILRPSAEMWQRHEVLFANVRQTGGGKQVPWDPTTLMSIYFEVGPYLSFDVSIDELAFIR